jgi:hypothetical protein
LVTAERKGGKVRQRTLAYLGDYPTADAAVENLPRDIMLAKWLLRQLRDNLL